jgi:nucleoside-diphosphate-sugar epimerase
MRIFMTGGTGEIGRPAVAALLDDGHSVTVATRSDANDVAVARQGAIPLRVDLTDAAEIDRAVAHAEPDAIMHLATRIPPSAAMGDPDAWVDNDRLRRETTPFLVDAALRHGVEVVVLQSYFAVAEPAGDAWIDPDPEQAFAADAWSQLGVMDSMRAGELAMRQLPEGGVRAVILRCGSLYSETSEQLQAQVGFLQAGAATIPADGANHWPYLASDDAGRAVRAALAAPTGTYHVADDEPLTLKDFWTVAAATVGTEAPPHANDVDGPMAGILLGSWRLSNRAFVEASGWRPEIRSARQGWPEAARRHLEADGA